MKEINELTGEEAAAELAHIAREMAKADIAYYQNDNPYLTDAEYDSLKKRNEEIEARFPELIREDSPSKKIGAPLKSGFGKIPHRFPMLSLGDVFSLEEVDDFVLSVKRFLNTADSIDFMAEPKIDGLSFSARYENGRFVHRRRHHRQPQDHPPPAAGASGRCPTDSGSPRRGLYGQS